MKPLLRLGQLAQGYAQHYEFDMVIQRSTSRVKEVLNMINVELWEATDSLVWELVYI